MLGSAVIVLPNRQFGHRQGESVRPIGAPSQQACRSRDCVMLEGQRHRGGASPSGPWSRSHGPIGFIERQCVAATQSEPVYHVGVGDYRRASSNHIACIRSATMLSRVVKHSNIKSLCPCGPTGGHPAFRARCARNRPRPRSRKQSEARHRQKQHSTTIGALPGSSAFATERMHQNLAVPGSSPNSTRPTGSRLLCSDTEKCCAAACASRQHRSIRLSSGSRCRGRQRTVIGTPS